MTKMHDIHTVVYDPKDLETMMKERLSQMIPGETLEFKLGDSEMAFRVTRLDKENFSAEWEGFINNPVQQPKTTEVVRQDEVSRLLKSHEEGIFLDPKTLATETINNKILSPSTDKLMQNVDSQTLAEIMVGRSYGETLSYPLHDWKQPAKEITLKDLLKRVDGFPKSDVSPKELLSTVDAYRKDSSNKVQYTSKDKPGIRTVEMENQPMLSQQRKEMILDQAATKAPVASQQMGQQM
ncbi:hypothetical protein [Paenibacillus taichungensis]|uniref:hypothetical protein n=1 Tax=Paenibacillus taichungensis TaxID=484184 RepID=UPI0035DB0512